MNFPRPAQHLPIGVDFGRDCLRLLQLRQRGSSLTVQAAAQVPMTNPLKSIPDDRLARAVDALATATRVGEFRGKNIVLSLPREFLTIKTLRLPMLADDELKSAIELEARNLFLTPPEGLIIRFLPAGEVRSGNESRLEVIVIAADSVLVEQLLERLHQAGFMVDSIDFEPSSLYRCVERFTRRKEDENEVSVLVDIGARGSQIVIGKGKDISFTKTIDIGSDLLNDCVARKLRLSPEDAVSLRRRFADVESEDRDSVRQAIIDATRDAMATLTHEVSLCLRYHSVTFRGQRPARVRLMGGVAYDASLRQALSAGLTIPVEMYSVLQGVGLGSTPLASAGTPLCEWGVAFGAALRRVSGDVFRTRDTARTTGRRASDVSIVEVVDLSNAMKSAGVMETSESRTPGAAKGAVHA